MRKRRNDKSHGRKHKAKKQESNNGNKKEYWIKTKHGSFKVFLDPDLVIKPGRFITFCGIGVKEKTFLRNQITIEKI